MESREARGEVWRVEERRGERSVESREERREESREEGRGKQENRVAESIISVCFIDPFISRAFRGKGTATPISD